MNERTGLYAILAVSRNTGVIVVHLNSRAQPWTTTGGAQRILKQLQEQDGIDTQLSVVPVVQS